MGASGREGDDATEAPRPLSTPRLATRGRLGYLRSHEIDLPSLLLAPRARGRPFPRPVAGPLEGPRHEPAAADGRSAPQTNAPRSGSAGRRAPLRRHDP